MAAKPFSWYLAPHSGLIVLELRGRRFYLNRPSDRLAFRRRVFAPLRHRMTPTLEGDALAGHFRANKNIAPRGAISTLPFLRFSLVLADVLHVEQKRKQLRFLSKTH